MISITLSSLVSLLLMTNSDLIREADKEYKGVEHPIEELDQEYREAEHFK
jgi:hypothetical protein